MVRECPSSVSSLDSLRRVLFNTQLALRKHGTRLYCFPFGPRINSGPSAWRSRPNHDLNPGQKHSSLQTPPLLPTAISAPSAVGPQRGLGPTHALLTSTCCRLVQLSRPKCPLLQETCPSASCVSTSVRARLQLGSCGSVSPLDNSLLKDRDLGFVSCPTHRVCVQ